MAEQRQNYQSISSSNDDIHQKSIYADFNNTVTDYPHNKTIVDIFENQVNSTPDNIAIRYKNIEITYNELNKRSNRLAHYLIEKGVKKNDCIGILVNRNPDIMIGMLAILKAGGTYVPIEPDYPTDRQKYIISNSSVSVVICNTVHYLTNKVKGLEIIQMDALDLSNYPSNNIGLDIDSHQLAYTIYTSGSTGNPKGVMIEHHSVVNLALWVNSTFSIGSEDRLLCITSICFDLSVYDIFGILFSGASLVIAEYQEIRDISVLTSLLKNFKITFWNSVPSTLDFLIRGLESANEEYLQTNLRLIFLSGDWIPVNLSERVKKYLPNADVISLGGATEATVWSNFYVIKQIDPSWKSIPYGKPIANNFFYILDNQLKPVPYGDPGELFIGGAGVARGYSNDKEKTAYSFITDPFNKDGGGRMYRTGDIGRMLPDGNMEFLGRKDLQVKIRGFRVELGEIENVIRQYEYVDNVVVTANEIKGIKRLAGYIVPRKKYDRKDMITFIKTKLPDYMIPGLWMELEALPLTTNGKIDRKGLPEMELKRTFSDETTTLNNEERAMIAIWEKVLGLQEINCNDNFFDIGGDSLLAIQLLIEIEKKFNQKIKIDSIYNYPTISLFVSQLKNIALPDIVYSSLISVKTTGTKTPLYFINGDGLNLIGFRSLATYLDKEQPLYTLEPKGLYSFEETIENDIHAIASHYIDELIRHNPHGPYLLAGYSFGGYVAIEMKNKLEGMGKKVKMIALIDTNADNLFYHKNLRKKLIRKGLRQFPKLLFIGNLLLRRPSETISYQKNIFIKKLRSKAIKMGVIKKPVLTGIEVQLEKIAEEHSAAMESYELKPFNGKLHLFNAKERLYFVDDFKYLGWQKFALDGVEIYDVPGDHKTMFFEPNVKELASLLQNVIDNS